jgi:hypothetical protein
MLAFDLQKAEEGVYADTPANRKKGIVGKKYAYLTDIQKTPSHLSERNKGIFDKFTPKILLSTNDAKISEIGSKKQNILIQNIKISDLHKDVQNQIIKVNGEHKALADYKGEIEVTIEDYEKLHHVIGKERKTENGKEFYKDPMAENTWYEVPKLSAFVHFKGGHKNITDILHK